MAEFQTKLTKSQYQALLDRTVSRKPAVSQASALNEMQGMMGGGEGDPNQEPMMQPPMGPSTAGMGMQMAQQAGVPEVDPMAMAMQGSPAPTMPGGIQGAIQQAEQAWMKLKGGIGEQLWNRLSQSAQDTIGLKPDVSFIQTVVKYMKDPNSIKDERLKEFIGSIVGAPSQPQGLQSLVPQLMSKMTLGQQAPGGM